MKVWLTWVKKKKAFPETEHWTLLAIHLSKARAIRKHNRTAESAWYNEIREVQTEGVDLNDARDFVITRKDTETLESSPPSDINEGHHA